MRKLNYIYEDMVLGLPMIGSGLARGNWDTIYGILEEELGGMRETFIVEYDK